MVFSAELPVSLYTGSFIVHTWFLTLSLEGFFPCPICPNSHPSSVSCLAPAREEEEHFKFNAVQRVGLYTQHSPGTDLQELGQWCQRLEILQQAKVWRAFLCSREFFFFKLFLRLTSFPPSFLCYNCLAPFKSGCSLRSQSHLPKIISGSYPPSVYEHMVLPALKWTTSHNHILPQPPDVLERVFGDPCWEKASQCNLLLQTCGLLTVGIS